MEKARDKISSNSLVKFILGFVITLITVPGLIFIQEFISDETTVNLRRVIIIAWGVLTIGLSGYFEWYQYNKSKELNEKIKNIEQNDRVKTVLSNITQLVDCKANYYRQSSYKMQVSESEYPFFYVVHNYLREVCGSLRLTIAEIIEAKSDYVDVSLIYKYNDDKQDKDWKWGPENQVSQVQ